MKMQLEQQIAKSRGFLLFGLQRCASNLCQRLLSDNLDIWLDNDIIRDWKHGFMPPHIWVEGRFVLIMVKHPQAWLLSMYQYCQRNVKSNGAFHDGTLQLSGFVPGMTFEKFLKSPHYAFKTPMDRWNVVNDHYLSRLESPHVAASGGYLVQRAEDLQNLRDQQQFVNKIASLTKTKLIVDSPIVFNMLISNQTEVTDRRARFAFYRSEKWADAYTPELLKLVEEKIDWYIATSKLGYSLKL